MRNGVILCFLVCASIGLISYNRLADAAPVICVQDDIYKDYRWCREDLPTTKTKGTELWTLCDQLNSTSFPCNRPFKNGNHLVDPYLKPTERGG